MLRTLLIAEQKKKTHYTEFFEVVKIFVMFLKVFLKLSILEFGCILSSKHYISSNKTLKKNCKIFQIPFMQDVLRNDIFLIIQNNIG